MKSLSPISAWYPGGRWTLGRVFRELQPYPLFPLDEYFNGPSRLIPGQVLMPPRMARPAHLQFPHPFEKIA